MSIEMNDAAREDISWESGLKAWVRKAAGGIYDLVLGSAATKNAGTAEGEVPILGTGGRLDSGVMPATGILPDDGTDGQVLTLESGSPAWADPASVSLSTFLIDEDDMASDSDTRVPSQQSTKAYVDALSTDLADAVDIAKGAELIGLPMSGGEFDGASTVMEMATYLAEEGLYKSQAVDLTEVTEADPTLKLVALRTGGGFGAVNPSNVPGLGFGDVIEPLTSSYTIQAADLSGTIIMSGANPTVTIPLFSALGWALNRGVYIVHGGTGTLTVNCASSSILLNFTANGSVATTGLGSQIRLSVIGGGTAGKWIASAPTAATTTDTTPPVVVSRSPMDGAVDVDVNGNIVITFDEPIQVGTAGTRTFTLRKWNGSAFADEEVFDLTTDIGTGAGQAVISGPMITFNPTSAMTAATAYAMRNTAGAVEDLSGNDCAAVADDATYNWTTASASLTLPTVVGSGPTDVSDTSWRILSTTAAGTSAAWVRTLPTLLTGDMLIWFDVCAATLSGLKVTTSGYSDIQDSSTSTVPGSYIIQKVMGGTPDTSITGGRVFDRNQAVGYLHLRGPNLTVSGSAGNSPTTTGSPDAPAYAQLYDNELRVVAMMLDSDDVDLGVSALTSAGWNIRVKTNAAGSSGQGSTLVVATLPAAGTAGTSVDPPASTGANNRYRTIHFGVRSA